MIKWRWGGGRLQSAKNANCEINIAGNSDSQKEKIWIPSVTIKIREKHNLKSIIWIVEKKKPIVLTLRSTDSRINNKVIDFYNYFTSNGWKERKTIVQTKKVNKKYRNMISFELLSPFLHSFKPVRRILKMMKDERPMTEKEVKCGSVAANAKLKS